jgi:GNAT superfamily N-acetyltransferase
MERIKYTSPSESIEEDQFRHHNFDLLVDEIKIGAAEVDYFSKPLPHYLLSDLYIERESKSKGYASKVLDQIEAWLKERRKPGILVDAIVLGDPARGMYERRGWQLVPDSICLYVYNWPEDVSLELLRGYSSRSTDYSERKNFKM